MTEEHVANLIDTCRRAGSAQSKKEALDGLCIYLYKNLDRFRLDNMDEDSRSDFITWMFPRFAGIIDQFDPKRASFRTYLSWVVRLSWRTFLKKRYSELARQRVYEMEEATTILSQEAEFDAPENQYACTADTKPDYQTVEQLSASEKKKEIHSRKIFLLACKAGNYLDDRYIKRVARSTGYSEQFITEKIEIIRNKCRKKREAERSLIEKKNGYYIRAQRCLFELKYLEKNTARYFQLKKEYDFCIKRIDSIRREESRRIRAPSNRFLAATLGISRGTIDATLASVRVDRYSEPI